ncbi:unnamed protein product [Choristocarpus tenellus]
MPCQRLLTRTLFMFLWNCTRVMLDVYPAIHQYKHVMKYNLVAGVYLFFLCILLQQYPNPITSNFRAYVKGPTRSTFVLRVLKVCTSAAVVSSYVMCKPMLNTH